MPSDFAHEREKIALRAELDQAKAELSKTAPLQELLALLVGVVGDYGRRGTFSSRQHLGAVYTVARDVLAGKVPEAETIAAWLDLKAWAEKYPQFTSTAEVQRAG